MCRYMCYCSYAYYASDRRFVAWHLLEATPNPHWSRFYNWSKESVITADRAGSWFWVDGTADGTGNRSLSIWRRDAKRDVRTLTGICNQGREGAMDGGRYMLQQAGWDNSSVRHTIETKLISIQILCGFLIRVSCATGWHHPTIRMMVHVLLTILTRKHTINHARPTPNVDMALLDLAEKEASCPPVSVLGADLPYFFWMHRLWRTTIPSTILTSGSSFSQPA